MSAPRLFVTGAALAQGATVPLPEAAAHHATRVLRLREGDAVTLFDGTGGEYAARLLDVDRRGATAIVERFVDVEREARVPVTLALAVLANDAMDYAVRKAVELGAAHIVPLVAARSQGGARAERRVPHWRQIAHAACEQCGRNRVPPVAQAVALDTWLAQADAADVILVPGAATALAACVHARPPRAIVVGPEGGFSDAELAQARARGLREAALGARILRAETAAVAALAIVEAVAA
jgi:16S rRNA (uracil1498-N3)-methyltransferase